MYLQESFLMQTKNPSARRIFEKLYPVFKKYTGLPEANLQFVGNCSVALIDKILDMEEFPNYVKTNQFKRIRKLMSHVVPLEFEEVLRLKQPGRKRFKINFYTRGLKMKNNKLLEKWKNRVICMDCVEGMKQLPDASADIFLFSPPYDMLRDYEGKPEFNLHQTGEQCYRILKDGGIAAMVIQDQTKEFAKSLTTFRTAVDWVDNLGFRLFECCLYHKQGQEGAWWTKRFRVDHEYILIFLKGKRPAFFDKEPLKIPSKHAGKTMTGCATRTTSGKTLKSKKVKINPTKCRGTVWDYITCGDGGKLKHQHPATFPEKLPYDLIQCFCPKNGLVIDPFMGSGTTGVAAIKLDRNFIGFDISQKYISEISEPRIKIEIEKKQQIYL